MNQAAPDTTIEEATDPGFDCISREGAIELLNELARESLGMSGEEFMRRYRAGQIEDPCDSDVTLLAMIIPLTEQ
jgi:hypothetical protein